MDKINGKDKEGKEEEERDKDIGVRKGAIDRVIIIKVLINREKEQSKISNNNPELGE